MALKKERRKPPAPAAGGASDKPAGPVGLVPVAIGSRRDHASPGRRRAIRIDVKVVRGSIFDQADEIAVLGRYIDTLPSGLLGELNGSLKGWLAEAIRLGLVSSELGCLFYVPILEKQIANSAVILAGMGEAGGFSMDDLRYLMTNVVYAVRGLRKRRFACVLIGSGATGLSVEASIAGLLDGIRDGLPRVPRAAANEDGSAADSVGEGDATPVESMEVVIVEREGSRCREILEILHRLASSLDPADGLTLATSPEQWKDDPAEEPEKPSSTRSRIEARSTRLTITKLDSGAEKIGGRVAYQFSALGDGAAASARDRFMSSAFLDLFPDRLSRAGSRRDQEALGLVLTSYLLPEDYRALLEADAPITLVLDPETARLPWEMAAARVHDRVRFLGVEPGVTRQFRTLQTIAPGVPPIADSSLRMLVIADPCDGDLALPNARKEGLTVLKAATLAHGASNGGLDVRVTLRIGSANAASAEWIDESRLRSLIPGCEAVLESIGPCDPLEVLSLLLDRRYDVVHYAGHGEFDEATGRKGWVFSRDCTLSADEVLKVRQVPRLVFANACLSSRLDGPGGEAAGVASRVSLAQAFFARGIPNYIGAAWPVNDLLGQWFAYHFYCRALGVDPGGSRKGGGPKPLLLKTGPDDLGSAMSFARASLIGRDSRATWGAYQHYGQSSSTLLA